MGLARPAVAGISAVGFGAAGLSGGWHLFGGATVWSLWLLLTPIWVMAAVFAAVASLDRVRAHLGPSTGDAPAWHTHLGDVHLAGGIALGGAAMCLAAWALSAAAILPLLGMAVAVVVGTLWEAMPGLGK